MSEAAAGAYAQLLSVGLVWISFHCAGMCGPLLVGFDVSGAARGWSVPKGAGAILLYQSGRAVTYVALGALAGTIGVGLEYAIGPAGAVFSLIFGGAVLLYALRPKRQVARRVTTRLEQRAAAASGEPAPREPLMDRVARALPRLLHPIAATPGIGRTFLLGAVMGLLPCMIVGWAIGLAATTASPLHGAGVMLLLVLMTTPVLLGVTLLPRVLRRLRVPHLQRILMGISGVWLLMVGLAGLKVISHLHLPIELFGDHYQMMLW
ncbi:MAG: sulfite exporter TauE/SafE family protein [Myxococcales bacterium]|nr:sulfite exporter TauE/SafE family protein [Myxococcales bacterium]MCB9735812.1 sulfite exporter TauE/SafE family protein [Deltaproteobacteria bacterium]